jgi:hypothetical protein
MADMRQGSRQDAREGWVEGWRLFLVLTLALAALCIAVAGYRQFEVEGVRMVVRFTARTSLLFFCSPSRPPHSQGSGRTRGPNGSAATAALSA